jgi:Xaa-Pro aminopeptidase
MRYEPIPNTLFKRNRAKLQRLLKPASIAIVNSNDSMPRNGDSTFSFRQHSDLFYLTGITQEETSLVLLPDGKEILFILKPDKLRETWEGRKLTEEEASMLSGIKTVKYSSDFEQELMSLAVKADYLYLNKNENARYHSDVQTKDDRFIHHIHQLFPLHRYERLAPLLSSLRVRKEPEEIALISKACSITHDGFLLVLQTIKPGMKEYEVEAALAYEFIRQGASGHAFDTIVASGENACYLHYNKNNQTMTDGSMVLIDFGSEYAQYASDCSRTIPVNGSYSKRQLQVYDACLEVFIYAQSIIRPGVSIVDYQKEVAAKMESELIKLGLFTRADVSNQDQKEPLYRNYFMHGVSHYMGLDTHDVGDRDSLLQPGMIVTCEPGIYIKEENIGVRIENDLLITDTGNRDLMADIPIYPSDIERLMKLR